MSKLPDNGSVRVRLCANLCEIASPRAPVGELEAALAATCLNAGSPHCERIYVGSYFCENYFLGLTDAFHESVRKLCWRYDLGATLVIPIVGQAFIERTWQRIPDLIARFSDVYDEVVVNDVAMFHDLQRWFAGESLPAIEGAREAEAHDGWQARRAPRLGM